MGDINHHFLILALFLHAFDAFVATDSLTLMHLPHDLSLTLAQLICPISYHDPTGLVWGILQQNILDRLPLRDVSWKSSGTISSSQTAVDKLPLRFMPSTASLFKDTDHPFRWFLAPYANIYFVNVDNLEAYKDTKATLKKWVETMVGLKRCNNNTEVCCSVNLMWVFFKSLISFVLKLSISSPLILQGIMVNNLCTHNSRRGYSSRRHSYLQQGLCKTKC